MREITLELTNKCLNSCLHCSSMADSNKDTYLEFDTIKEMLDKYNPEWVNISGGEPLLHDQIIQIVEYIHGRNIKIKLYTSGFDPCFVEKFKIIYQMIDSIVFPYYSDDVRIFNKVINNNKGFWYVSRAIGLALGHGVNTEVHIVPMTPNIEGLDRTIGFLVDIGINKINILKLVNQGRVNENKFLIPDDGALEEILLEIKDHYQDKVKLGLPFDDVQCMAGVNKMVILCDGREIPCESYKDGICKCKRLKIK